MIRKRILLYIPIFIFLISCGVGVSVTEDVDTDQDFSNKPPAGNNGDTNKPVADENTIRAFILSGTVNRISIELRNFSLSILADLEYILSRFNANNINAQLGCDFSGEVNVNINTVDKTFTFTYDQCKPNAESELNCTVTGSYNESGGMITDLIMTFSDGCMLERISLADITFYGSTNLSMTFNRRYSDCASTDGFEGSIYFSNLNVSFSFLSYEFSVQGNDIRIDFDAKCKYSNYFSYNLTGSFTYEDNYCLNSSVSVNVQTITPVSYFLDSNDNFYNCGGEIIINNGEIKYVVNNNCYVDLYSNNIFLRSIDFNNLTNYVGSCSIPD